jgi:hypothetical protein
LLKSHESHESHIIVLKKPKDFNMSAILDFQDNNIDVSLNQSTSPDHSSTLTFKDKLNGKVLEVSHYTFSNLIDMRSETISLNINVLSGKGQATKNIILKINELALKLGISKEFLQERLEEGQKAENLASSFFTLIQEINEKKYLLEIANTGDSIAQFNYAGMCLKGKGGAANYDEAKHYIKLSIDGGNIDAYPVYANMCQTGLGGVANPKEARKYFKLSVEQGTVKPQIDYASMCEKGQGGPVDLEEARKYYKKSADQGNVEAQQKYAIMCNFAQGGPEDLETGRKYHKLAAEQGLSGGKSCYAYMCVNQEGGPLDLKIAKQYYLELIAENFPEAQDDYDAMVALYPTSA